MYLYSDSGLDFEKTHHRAEDSVHAGQSDIMMDQLQKTMLGDVFGTTGSVMSLDQATAAGGQLAQHSAKDANKSLVEKRSKQDALAESPVRKRQRESSPDMSASPSPWGHLKRKLALQGKAKPKSKAKLKAKTRAEGGSASQVATTGETLSQKQAQLRSQFGDRCSFSIP